MATMQQPGAGEQRAGAQFDRRDARLALVALTILAAAIGTAVVFTQSHSQKTTTAGITETLRFPHMPEPIAAGTDALWVALNPALDHGPTTGSETQKFGSLERVNLTSGAIERTLRIPGFVGPVMLHLGNVLWISHNGNPDRTGPGELDELDWRTGKLLGRLAFDRGIFDLAYDNRSLWVTVGASPATLVASTRRPCSRSASRSSSRPGARSAARSGAARCGRPASTTGRSHASIP
jgi:hypothetical protein